MVGDASAEDPEGELANWPAGMLDRLKQVEQVTGPILTLAHCQLASLPACRLKPPRMGTTPTP
jgi:hypothetical protein